MGNWIATLELEGMVTHIGLEHITLMTREQDYVNLPNDNVIQAGVTNYSRPTMTHICSV
jgi:small-conductance mechanosensitive channel